jgi:hypothetical protein
VLEREASQLAAHPRIARAKFEEPEPGPVGGVRVASFRQRQSEIEPGRREIGLNPERLLKRGDRGLEQALVAQGLGQPGMGLRVYGIHRDGPRQHVAREVEAPLLYPQESEARQGAAVVGIGAKALFVQR